MTPQKTDTICQFRLNISKSFFFSRLLKQWNKVDQNISNSQSSDIFKNSILNFIQLKQVGF